MKRYAMPLRPYHCSTAQNPVIARSAALWQMSRYLLLCCGLGLVGNVTAAEAPTQSPQEATAVQVVETSAAELIAQAGSDDDVANFQTLERLLKLPELDEGLRRDAKTLHGWLRSWTQDKMLTKAPNAYKTPMRIKAQSDLYPLAQYYYARAYATYALQYGKIRHWKEKREEALKQCVAAFRIAQEAYPNNQTIGIYLGTAHQPWPTTYADHRQAPAWANSQRRMLEGITDIIHWHIEHRQQKNGSFGSGRGDDVEMWRWWSPILVGFADPVVNKGQARLSKWVENSLKGSYTSRSDDVEHTSEDSTDSFLPMMFAKPGDASLRQHALNLADLFKNEWTGINERGHLQFKNLNFTINGITGKEKTACDTLWHCRAILPSLLLWQQGEDSFDELFLPWLRTWVDATAREERGKPAGIIPSAIHWPSGRIGGPGKRWYIPEIYKEKLYYWPNHMNPMLQHLLHAWQRTGDDSFLAPMHSMVAIRQAYLKDPVENPEPGSEAWCASKLGKIVQVVAKYRLLSGDTQYDDFIFNADVDPYLRYRMTGEQAELEAAFANDAAALSENFPLYTTEVRFYDRAINRPGYWYRNSQVDMERPILRRRWDMGELYASVTGDMGGVEHFPIRAVRWLTPARDIAALVSQANPTTLTAELFHYGDSNREMGLELWLLQPGTYTMTLQAGDNVMTQEQITIEKPGKQVPLTLPPQQLCNISIVPTNK